MAALKEGVAARGLDNFRFLPYQRRDMLEDSLAAADVHLVSLLPALEGYVVPSKLYGILAAGRPLIFIGDGKGDVGRVIEQGSAAAPSRWAIARDCGPHSANSPRTLTACCASAPAPGGYSNRNTACSGRSPAGRP